MQSRTPKQQMLTISILIVSICVISAFSHPETRNNLLARFTTWHAVAQPEIVITQEIRVGLPTTLIIPTINVWAPVESVGLTTTGALDVPEDPAHVAWFNQGPRPGEKGVAIIDGHFGWKDGLPAVFDNLSQVHIGDTILVQDADNQVIHFVIRDIRAYEKDADTSDIFRATDDGVHLVLITCQGEWDEINQSYSSRLVVFADKIETPLDTL